MSDDAAALGPGTEATSRVARIPYLNSAPFYLHWDRIEESSEGRWSGLVLPPRQLGWAAAAGEVDAGLMAVADLIRLEATFEPLYVPSAGAPVSFGIANRDRVESVLLFVRNAAPRPDPAHGHESEHGSGRGPAARAKISPTLFSPEEAHRLRGTRVAITGETSTSFRLLRLLLEVRHGIRPEYARTDLAGGVPNEVGGALVIGDLALRWLHRPPEGMTLAMDLAAEWHDWTGLPFVFARWGIRRSVPEPRKEWLGRFLESSLRESEGRIEELVAGYDAELGSEATLAAYLRNFTYRLGPEELHGAERFRALLDEHGIVCSSE